MRELRVHLSVGLFPSVPSLPSTQIQSFPGLPSTGTTIVPPCSPCGHASQSLFIFFQLGSVPGTSTPVVGVQLFHIHVQYTLFESGYLTIANCVYVVHPIQSHSRCGDIPSSPGCPVPPVAQSCQSVQSLQFVPFAPVSPFAPFGPVAQAGIHRLRVYIVGSSGSCTSCAVGLASGCNLATVPICRLGVCPSFPCGPCGANCVALLYVNVHNVGLKTSSSLNCHPTSAFVE